MIWIKHIFVALLAILMSGVVFAVLGIGILSFRLRQGPVDLPWVKTFIENRVNAQFDGFAVDIETFSMVSNENGLGNTIVLREVGIEDKQGDLLLLVPEIQAHLSWRELLKGHISPKDITVIGADVLLHRRPDGSFILFDNLQAPATDSNVLALLNSVILHDELSVLSKIQLKESRIIFYEQDSGRNWTLDNSTLTILRDGDALTGRAEMSFAEDKLDKVVTDATMILNAKYTLGAKFAEIAIQFADAEPAKIANLFLAFDWLRNIETQASGAVRAQLDGTGRLGKLHGVLELNGGGIKDTPESQEIAFEDAKVYFNYDVDADTLNVSELAVKTGSGSFLADGYVQLERQADKTVNAMVGQLRLTDIVISRPDLFPEQVSLEKATIDLRTSFAPLRVHVGQMTIFDQDATYRLKGFSVAQETHWRNRYDIDVQSIDLPRLLQLWPTIAVPKTREWIVENAQKGRVRDFAGGMKSVGGKFEYAFNFELDDAQFEFIDTIPPVQEGKGFGSLTQDDLRLTLTAGYVTAPNNTKVNAAGSSFYIPDIQAKPTPGEITVKARGGVQAGLQLLDADKFRFISKAGLKPTVADGVFEVAGQISLPLEKDTKLDSVQMDLTAQLTDLRSSQLIKGRKLSAVAMVAKITEEGVTLKGPARLDGVPLQVTWSQGFDKSADQTGRIKAQVNLTDQNLRRLGVELPKGTVKGSTPANVSIEMVKGKAPSFRLTSNLVGATLRIPEIGWSKGSRTKGSLQISGRVPGSVDVDRLVLKAPRLNAIGSLDISKEGQLTRAKFSTVEVGKWLNAPVTLVPSGRNNLTIVTNGGSVDLRYLEGLSGGGSSSGSTKLKLTLDRVRVTNELSLTAFRANLTSKNGLAGKFSGQVNGGTRVDGTLFPQRRGTAVEIKSTDAGGTLASAKLLDNARGGNMRVVLLPVAGAGNYDGTVLINRMRIKKNPAMANLLNAISLVGILQQLNGSGIHFNKVQGKFQLRNKGVKLEKISAVGPSIGMTVNGWYDTRRDSIFFEGVITPLYVLNGVFERLLGPLVGRQKGEGLFSFTYKMRGPAAKPKVSVNPFSILTPGAFREIFRAKIPEPAQ